MKTVRRRRRRWPNTVRTDTAVLDHKSAMVITRQSHCSVASPQKDHVTLQSHSGILNGTSCLHTAEPRHTLSRLSGKAPWGAVTHGRRLDRPGVHRLPYPPFVPGPAAHEGALAFCPGHLRTRLPQGNAWSTRAHAVAQLVTCRRGMAVGAGHLGTEYPLQTCQSMASGSSLQAALRCHAAAVGGRVGSLSIGVGAECVAPGHRLVKQDPQSH